MGTFKLQIPTAKLLFTQVLNAGGSRFLAWSTRSPRLFETQNQNVIDRARRFESRAKDSALVTEFRARLRLTEDLIGKLGYSLRELSSKNR